MPYCLFRDCLCFRDRADEPPECEGCIQTWSFNPIEKARYETYKKTIAKLPKT